MAGFLALGIYSSLDGTVPKNFPGGTNHIARENSLF